MTRSAGFLLCRGAQSSMPRQDENCWIRANCVHGISTHEHQLTAIDAAPPSSTSFNTGRGIRHVPIWPVHKTTLCGANRCPTLFKFGCHMGPVIIRV
jgi:hypothetical protein